MSRDLKKRGFKFVGSTICYAFMQATGMVNDHADDCFRRNDRYDRYRERTRTRLRQPDDLLFSSNSYMFNLKLALRDPVPDAVRDGRRHPVARPRHRGQCGHLFAVQPDHPEAAAGARRRPAGEPGESRAEVGHDLLRRCRTVATRSSATRCSATSRSSRPPSRASRRTGASARTSPTRASRQGGDGLEVSGSYFPVLGLSAGRRPSVECERRPRAWRVRTSSVLSHRYWRTRFAGDPGVVERHAHRQRPAVHDRRRRRRRGSTARRSASRPQVFVPITMTELLQPGRARCSTTGARTGSTCSRD